MDLTNKLSIISRRLAATAFAVSAFWATAAAQTDDCSTYSHDSTMNALDYVLQRPLPSDRFENKRFGDRLFLTVEAGPDWMRTDDGLIGSRGKTTGYRAGITIGDWVTPVHGWRISLGGGRHSGVDDTKPYFASFAADYLMNLSALLRHDNPSRRFELIGLIGLEGEALHRRGHKLWAAGGIRIGLQPRVYLNNSTFLYIEPRIGVYTDGLDDVKTWHRYDWNASLMIGLGYRLNAGRGHRVDNSLWINDCFRDNMIVGLSGGVNMLGRSTDNLRSRLGLTGGVFVGKWFTPSSGLRLTVSGAELKMPGFDRRWAGLVDIDYMWNLNSTMNGYDPDRAIEANIILGVSGAYTTNSGTKLYPGFHLGAQGVWNVSRSVGLYIEPQLRGFGKSLSFNTSRRLTFMPSLNLGLIYRFRGSEGYRRYRTTFDYNDFLGSDRYFFDLTGGFLMRFKTWAPNFDLALGFGKWFTPESAWRVRGDYTQITRDATYRSATVSGDYMLSLTTLASGFDATRPFDLDIFAGVTAGVARYNRGKNDIVWGAEAGLRGRFRVSNSIDILLEPSVAVLRIPDYNRRKFSPEAKLMAGVSYKLGRKPASSSKSGSTVSDDTDRFIMLSAGPNLFSETILSSGGNKFSWSADATGGYWFNDVSGIQAGLTYDFINRRNSSDLYVGYIHVDYMFNLTGFFTGRRNGNFSLSAFGGPGLGWSNRCGGNVSPVGRLGLEARFRLSHNLDLTLSPNISIWLPRLEQGRDNRHHFAGTGTLPIGVAYRF